MSKQRCANPSNTVVSPVVSPVAIGDDSPPPSFTFSLSQAEVHHLSSLLSYPISEPEDLLIAVERAVSVSMEGVMVPLDYTCRKRLYGRLESWKPGSEQWKDEMRNMFVRGLWSEVGS